MPQVIHFISGLPRSGSTLLSAILRQNPRFSAAVTSPVYMLCSALVEKMSGNGEFSPFFDDARRRALLRSVFGGYYAQSRDRSVVFDTNRLWTGRLSLLRDLYPEARVICCVRNVGWIIDSVERMLRSNPLQNSRIFNYKSTGSVYERAEVLMNSETGLVGLPWSTAREAWFGEKASGLIVIEYDSLVLEPGRVMRGLYGALGEPEFTHDFENVVYDAPDYDAILGMPGLHRVRRSVRQERRDICIPPDLFARYAEASFWSRPQSNLRGVCVL